MFGSPGHHSLVGKNLKYQDELKLHVGRSGDISSGLSFWRCRLRRERILSWTLSAEGTACFLDGTNPSGGALSLKYPVSAATPADSSLSH